VLRCPKEKGCLRFQKTRVFVESLRKDKVPCGVMNCGCLRFALLYGCGHVKMRFGRCKKIRKMFVGWKMELAKVSLQCQKEQGGENGVQGGTFDGHKVEKEDETRDGRR
jgi:hypothetical protein